MNVAGPARSRPVPLSAYGQDTGTSVGSSSSNDVDMYLDVPSFELSLDEFEEYALARLKVSDYCLIWLVQSYVFRTRISGLIRLQNWCVIVGASDHKNVITATVFDRSVTQQSDV